MTKKLMLLTCATGALGLWANASYAATATTAAAATSDTGTVVGELVVVAEHRQTALQKIPAAVSVFTGKQRDLVGISTVQEVANFAPGFSWDAEVLHPYIRGVGRQSINLTDDARVAAYEDEFFVTFPYQLAKSSLFLSQEQIERGPQNVGGRNADGGSIDMVSVRPSERPYAEVRATISNYDHYEVEGAVSGQVAPGLDLRLAGYDNSQNQGYYQNLAGGPSEGGEVQEWYTELQADWKPTDKAELWVRGYVANWDNRGDAGARNTFSNGSWDETNLTGNAWPGVPGAGLFVNPNYGYAGFNNAARAHVDSADVVSGQVPIIGDTVLSNPAITNNPSITNPNTFAAEEARQTSLKGYEDLNGVFTYDFGGVQMKYIGGYQQYKYLLNYGVPDSNVVSYTLPGSIGSGAIIAGLNGIGFPGASPLPAASTLLINPLVNVSYGQSEAWFSHELLFQSTDDKPLQWTVGGYFYQDNYSNPVNISAPNQAQLATPVAGLAGLPGPIINALCPTPGHVCGFTAPVFAAPNPSRDLGYENYNFTDQSAAGYAQVSYRFNDEWKITGNLRYTSDNKFGVEDARFIAFNSMIIDGLAPYFGANTPAADVTTTQICPTGVATSCSSGPLAPGVKSIATVNTATGVWSRPLSAVSSAFTGGAGVEWTPTNDIFVFAKYSRGYEGASFTAGQISANPEVAPEFLDSYEGGYKQNLGHNLSFDIDGFYYAYHNLQLPVDVITGAVVQNQFINVPESESTGVELEGYWTPIHNLLISLSYSYDYSAILTGCSGSLSGGVLTPSAGSLCVVDANDPDAVLPGNTAVAGQTAGKAQLQSVKGDPLPDAPQNKIAFSAAYTWNFDPGSFTLEGSYAWRDQQYGSVFTRWYNRAPSWDDVDFRGVWKGPHDRYEIIGFVKNAFNTLQYSAANEAFATFGTASASTTKANGLFESPVYSLAPPRTFGMEVRYKFF